MLVTINIKKIIIKITKVGHREPTFMFAMYT